MNPEIRKTYSGPEDASGKGGPMRIRKATGEEMLALWGCPDSCAAPPTARLESLYMAAQKKSADRRTVHVLQPGGQRFRGRENHCLSVRVPG